MSNFTPQCCFWTALNFIPCRCMRTLRKLYSSLLHEDSAEFGLPLSGVAESQLTVHLIYRCGFATNQAGLHDVQNSRSRDPVSLSPRQVTADYRKASKQIDGSLQIRTNRCLDAVCCTVYSS